MSTDLTPVTSPYRYQMPEQEIRKRKIDVLNEQENNFRKIDGKNK